VSRSIPVSGAASGAWCAVRVRVSERGPLTSHAFPREFAGREREPIDLHVTDVGLPGMDGLSVAHRLKEMSPNMRALIISGYSKERILRRWKLDGQADILSKPFTRRSCCL
jgi:CheY-like chemotaxis protein